MRYVVEREDGHELLTTDDLTEAIKTARRERRTEQESALIRDTVAGRNVRWNR